MTTPTISPIARNAAANPRNAVEKARRASLVYVTRIMGRADVEDQGPTFLRQEIKDDKLVLTFTHTGRGLMLNPKIAATLLTEANPATDLLGMAIAGSDGKFFWAKGVLGKDTVTLSSPDIPAPTQVRYVWADDLRQLGNLVNSDGLPVPSFKSIPSVPLYDASQPLPSAPVPTPPAPPADGVYEGEFADFFSSTLSASTGDKEPLSNRAALLSGGKNFTVEWLRVAAPTAGPQNLVFRVKTPGSKAILRVNGAEISTVVIPDTKEAYALVTVPEVPLLAGPVNRVKLLSAPDNENGIDLDAFVIGNPNAFNALKK